MSILTSEAVQWAIDYLTRQASVRIVNHYNVVQTPYSQVHKIETIQDVFYLKQTPRILFLEAKILAFLHEQGCQNIPEFVAENEMLHCFLMRSCGDVSLRHLFNGETDIVLMSQGILHYTKIQRTMEPTISELINIGALDWRLPQFTSCYENLLQQKSLLLSDGLNQNEIDNLVRLIPLCATLCDELSQHPIPATINHCDFHENNMIIDKKNWGYFYY